MAQPSRDNLLGVRRLQVFWSIESTVSRVLRGRTSTELLLLQLCRHPALALL